MITLNLVSPQQRRQLLHKNSYIIVLRVVAAATLLFILIIFGLSFVQKKLNNESIVIDKKIAEEKLRLAQTTSSSFDEMVTALNGELTLANGLQKSYFKWTRIIQSFTAATTPGITLSYLILKNDKAVEIRGVAKTRTDLLTFKEKLEEANVVEAITLPISNLVKKDDVDFNLSAILKLTDANEVSKK